MSSCKVETVIIRPDRAEAFRALLLGGAKAMMSEELRLSSSVSESSGRRVDRKRAA
ncbi:hypothetical protein [Proteus terrae]|uniref:hypothetical protein n=1 Tax=Proteus terrae TaxID=1574161 RepID=UPI00301D695C